MIGRTTASPGRLAPHVALILAALGAAIGQLAAACQKFFASNGARGAQEAVAAAARKVDSICPGAAS
jgi:hypothetical protein